MVLMAPLPFARIPINTTCQADGLPYKFTAFPIKTTCQADGLPYKFYVDGKTTFDRDLFFWKKIFTSPKILKKSFRVFQNFFEGF
jgi:hypothetical protein